MVGVPVMRPVPEFRVSPAGREPTVSVQTYGTLPPFATWRTTRASASTSCPGAPLALLVLLVVVLAFALSALYAGVAGSCSVLILTQASADKVQTFQLSIEFLVAVVIGGTATVIGPLLGGALVVFVQNAISNTLPKHVASTGVVGRVLANPAASPAIFGILLILFVFVHTAV